MNQEFILVKLQKGEVHFNNQREGKANLNPMAQRLTDGMSPGKPVEAINK